MSIIPSAEKQYVDALFTSQPASDTAPITTTLKTLNLQPHIEGGHFVETDRDPSLVPNPFQSLPQLANATAKDTSETRHASTTIYYYVTPKSPIGHFHRNRGRTVHTLHWGRGRYVIIHFDEVDREEKGRREVRIETFVVGHDIANGERLQWIVEGGKFKASFLLPDVDGGLHESEKGLLISETVVPGFEFSDHDFMTAEQLVDSMEEEQVRELKWLLKKDEQGKVEDVLKKQ